MQLRSRTITVSEPMTVSITYTTKKENEIKKENETREYPVVIDFINKLKKEFYNFADSSCLKNINNLYSIYDILDTEFENLLSNKIDEVVIVNFVLTLYKNTLRLMSDIINKTYNIESINCTSSEKKKIIKTLFKMRSVFIKLRELLVELKENSPHMKKLLCYLKDHVGENITKNSSNEATCYLCYRHFYNSDEENEYEMHSYEDGIYSYAELYNYYYINNVNNEVEEDLFIKNDYEWWFENERNMNVYDTSYNNKIDTNIIYTIQEVKHRITFHKRELQIYSKTTDEESETIKELHRTELEKYENILLYTFKE